MKIKKKKRKKYNLRLAMWGYLMILPVLLGLTIFFIIPFFQNIFYSFTDLNSFGVWNPVGFDNYKELFKDENFYLSLRNTLKYTIITVPISVLISMSIANLLNKNIKGVGIYRTLYFLPAVTMPAAVAMIWKWIYNGQYGLLNQFIMLFGGEPRAWIADNDTALLCIIVVGIWMSLGMNIVYFLAGMQSIPKQYYEAAKLDGASEIKQFFTITVPLVAPTLVFVLTTSMISSLQVFDIVFMMITKTSPALKSTQTIVYLFYQSAIDFGRKGYGAAIATILFIIIMILTFLQLKIQRKWVGGIEN
ncbi:carbohydrate ABC transporter permease [Anaerococcus porci]|uniref:Sugar ABC transporter permease n=1 Tax=Anaerococcus porci TaxID=2652269 RepID=A0A6N7VF00_9FIRM|nr:sugar ABC transporter permease [Anaerococcus porci]MDY3005895.1 sugar ABC transporter permease [Anaerococcus porci]MSS77461.1 sugar ABC transporter permease [Anaerococcus porci]